MQWGGPFGLDVSIREPDQRCSAAAAAAAAVAAAAAAVASTDAAA